MIDSVLDWADPHIADVLWYLVIVPILDRIRWIYKTKESRDALHSALRTGVNKITDLLVPVILANPIGFKLDQYAGMVANHVFNSVPDALKFLLGKPWFMRLIGKKPMTETQQREWIEGMAKGVLNEWAADFIAKLRPDELTEALKKANAPAVEPSHFTPQFSHFASPYYVGDPPPQTEPRYNYGVPTHHVVPNEPQPHRGNPRHFYSGGPPYSIHGSTGYGR